MAPANSSAYSHRSTLWVLQNYARTVDSKLPSQPAAVYNKLTSYITELVQVLEDSQRDGGFLAYVNYVDPALDAATAHQLYYGDETYKKLLAIKEQVDPGRVLWNPQAIGA